MNLLLTNDDGFDSKGIQILADKLSAEHNVFIIAPDRNRSAVSNCIKMYESQELVKKGPGRWTCSGFPADCVINGVRSSLLGVKIDAVLSGINQGSNLGSDIIYSGTCAAARQAALYKIPGIALSLDPVDWKIVRTDRMKFDALADFAAKNIENFVNVLKPYDGKYFLNINAVSADSYRGVKTGRSLCKRQYEDSIRLIDKGSCMQTDFIPGQGETLCEEDGDFSVVRSGYISVSTVYAEPVPGECVDCNVFSL